MKNEAISLLLWWLVLLPAGGIWVRAERDIFEGMSASDPQKEPTDATEEFPELDDGPTKCVGNILPDDPIDIQPAVKLVEKIQALVGEAKPTVPSLPQLPPMWPQLVDIFQLPKFSQMGAGLKKLIGQYRLVIEQYTQQWQGYFKARFEDAIDKMQVTVQKANKEIRATFARNFDEFDDLCLPETNKCLQSIEDNLLEYEGKVVACKRFADRQLDQHLRLLEAERKALEQPLLRVDGCFERTNLPGSIASCVGNTISNVMQQVTRGMGKFSAAMQQASDGFTTRMGKFQECVVNRKKLLNKGEQRIAEKAKQCISTLAQSQGELFV